MVGGSLRWTTAISVASVATVLSLEGALSAGPQPLPAGDRPRALSRQADDRPADALSAGKLLVADRGLGDPNFLQTVVLLIAHNKEGTAGLILNRQTEMTLESILPGPGTSKAKPGVVFRGGPVERSRARVLLRSSPVRRDAPRILPDVYFFDSREMLNKVLSDAAGPDRLRVYVGYTGWGAGQLEREIGLGAWHVFDGKSDIVFDSHPDTMWHRHIRRTELLSV